MAPEVRDYAGTGRRPTAAGRSQWWTVAAAIAFMLGLRIPGAIESWVRKVARAEAESIMKELGPSMSRMVTYEVMAEEASRSRAPKGENSP